MEYKKNFLYLKSDFLNTCSSNNVSNNLLDILAIVVMYLWFKWKLHSTINYYIDNPKFRHKLLTSFVYKIFVFTVIEYVSIRKN